METLLPDVSRHPYYISTPPYVQTSAGIRVLHLLCHWLNLRGERAFVVPSSHSPRPQSPDLLTPLLVPEILEHHERQGKLPIVIYPETEAGNRLQADFVVRYVLNTPGHLAGEKIFSPRDLVWAYSEYLRTRCERCDGVLHMPVVDQNLFRPDPAARRKGVVFYAAKYRQVHGQKPFGMPEDAIEITRDVPGSQIAPEVARLLQTCETFYCFENTAMAIEAVLCGTPAVFMPNDYLEKPIALDELGWDGYAWGNNPAEVARARATVAKGQENYERLIGRFHDQLANFVLTTQGKASERQATRSVSGETAKPSVFVVVGTPEPVSPDPVSEIVPAEQPAPEPTPLPDFPVLQAIDTFRSREIAATIRNRNKWRFHEWFRIVRALNVVAVRSILRSLGLARRPDSR